MLARRVVSRTIKCGGSGREMAGSGEVRCGLVEFISYARLETQNPSTSLRLSLLQRNSLPCPPTHHPVHPPSPHPHAPLNPHHLRHHPPQPPPTLRTHRRWHSRQDLVERVDGRACARYCWCVPR